MVGQYEDVEYLANNFQNKYWLRQQPETRTLNLSGRDNTPAGDNYIDKLRIKVSGSRRGIAPFARIVSFRFTGEVPIGYREGGSHTLPWSFPQGFNEIAPGMIGTYQGFPIVVTGKRDEKLR